MGSSKNFKYPAWRCRSDLDFRDQYYTAIRTFYRYTDGIFNMRYMGKIFKTTAKYVRKVILECDHCQEIINRRRYRRGTNGIPRKILKVIIVKQWQEVPDERSIDYFGVKFNVPVVSVQTILNKREDASEEEATLQRPLSFLDADGFYLNYGWKDEEGYWTPSELMLGWGLNPEARAKSRTFNEFPWPNSDDAYSEAFKDLCKGVGIQQAMSNHGILDLDQFKRYIRAHSSTPNKNGATI